MEVAMLPLLLAISASVLPTGFAIDCYVCSWSPEDDVNRTNICSKEFFSPREILTTDCKDGCEIYMQWDKNDALEHIRRNCIGDKTAVIGRCASEDNIAYKWERCTCDEDLCNSAISWSTFQQHLLILKLGALLLSSCVLQLVVI